MEGYAGGRIDTAEDVGAAPLLVVVVTWSAAGVWSWSSWFWKLSLNSKERRSIRCGWTIASRDEEDGVVELRQ